MSTKKISIILLFTVLVVIALFAFTSPTDNSDNLGKSTEPLALTVQNVTAPPIPSSLDFAGEEMPLDEFDVYERIDRELTVNTFYHSQMIKFLKLAPRYFEIIEPILKDNKIPDDFKYLALAESSFDQKALSPSGAAGIWQFMKDAGKQYGLEVNDDVDERYNIEKATVAACKYLQESYSIYGNWTMVAASFNAGKAGVKRLSDIQKESNYYELLMAEETNRYVYRIVALKTILNAPEKYGFHVKKSEAYPSLSFKNVEVSGAIANLTDFAKKNGTSYKLLKTFNPWLRDTSLKNEFKKTYQIKIPKMK
jgi:membrane-bound lytic murein transglycosylase D